MIQAHTLHIQTATELKNLAAAVSSYTANGYPVTINGCSVNQLVGRGTVTGTVLTIPVPEGSVVVNIGETVDVSIYE